MHNPKPYSFVFFRRWCFNRRYEAETMNRRGRLTRRCCQSFLDTQQTLTKSILCGVISGESVKPSWYPKDVCKLIFVDLLFSYCINMINQFTNTTRLSRREKNVGETLLESCARTKLRPLTLSTADEHWNCLCFCCFLLTPTKFRCPEVTTSAIWYCHYWVKSSPQQVEEDRVAAGIASARSRRAERL